MACTKYYGCNSNSMTAKILLDILNKNQILKNVPMKEHTSFKTGGNAEFMVFPSNVEELKAVVDAINATPYYIIGNGSNLLVCDEGLEGVVIKLAQNFSQIEVSGTEIKSSCGASLNKLANSAYNNTLGGAEFLCGIPGTLGGGITMNAGAYDNEIGDFIKEVTLLDSSLNIIKRSKEQMEFDYRKSIITKENYIVLEATLEFFPKEKSLIKEKMLTLNRLRKEKQPLDFPSAGSTFKRPTNNYAGALIQQCGLKGYSIKDACVSPKHCGFIINKGNATSKDIFMLINYVKETVHTQTGVLLECEVKMLGNFDKN